MTNEKPARTLGLGLKHVAGDNSPRDTKLSILSAAKRKNLATPTDANHIEESTAEPSHTTDIKVTDSVSNRVTESVTNRVPKYRQLKRREARIHEEQADELTLMARQLNLQRKRPDGTTVGERITDNTLIRVAIDLLLQRREELHGTTEQELSMSLGLPPRVEE